MSNKKIILLFAIILIIAIVSFVFYITLLGVNDSHLYKRLEIDKSKLNIFYLDVGQGDSTIITLNGKTILIDAGNDSDGCYINYFLKSQNVNSLDYVIGTHSDEDHIGGMDTIINLFDISYFYMPIDTTPTKNYIEVIDSAKMMRLNIEQPSKDFTFYIGDAEARILSNASVNYSDSNNQSMVLEIIYENTKYLFMADASIEIEKTLLLEDIDVLKVAHHGSKTATSEEFLNIVKPNHSIISVGNPNSYDLPSSEVINNLGKISKVYRTDELGTIWLSSDGNVIDIKNIDYNINGANRKLECIN